MAPGDESRQPAAEGAVGSARLGGARRQCQEGEDSYFATSDSDTGGDGGNSSSEGSYESGGAEAAGSGGGSPQRAAWEPSDARRSHYELRDPLHNKLERAALQPTDSSSTPV